jgi:hypothetical protein
VSASVSWLLIIGATAAPFVDSSGMIPSREFIISHFRFILRFSACSGYYYAPFFPTSYVSFYFIVIEITKYVKLVLTYGIQSWQNDDFHLQLTALSY